MNVTPIKTTRDYDRALRRIERLMDAKPGGKNGDELDVLTTLVEAYEAKHHAIYPPDPVEAIKFRMDQLGLTRKDLEAMLGGRGRVSEILTKKRGLSLEIIRRLHRDVHARPAPMVASRDGGCDSGAGGRVGGVVGRAMAPP